MAFSEVGGTARGTKWPFHGDKSALSEFSTGIIKT